MMTEQKRPIFPFIETDQYHDFVAACEYARRNRVMTMIHSHVGNGKSISSRYYIKSLPLMSINGRPDAHLMPLLSTQKTDRGFLNNLFYSITGQRRHLVADDAMEEIKRIIIKYRISLLIIDEIGYLQEGGLEAIRTLHDPGTDVPFIPVVLITMTDVKNKLQHDEKLEKFYSRIGQFLRFKGPSLQQIKEEILPKALPDSHIKFDPKPRELEKRKEADETVRTLFELSHGTPETGANFRDMVHILENYREAYDNALAAQKMNPESNTRLPPFNAKILRQVARYAKGIEPPDNEAEKG